MTVGAFLFIASCKKNDKDVAEDTGYSTEHTVAEKSFDDAQSIADMAATVASGSNLGYKTTELTAGGCATVTRSTGSIVIDFGATNCMCLDGRNRRGKILVAYTGAYADSGSVHTITFDNYYQNDNKVEGTKTVTNMGNNSAGQPYFSVVVSGTIILSTGGTMTTAFNRTRTWTAGYTTLGDRSDDVYAITGGGTITRPSGSVVAVAISNTAPLLVAAGCRWIEAGTITYTLASGAMRTINYGTTPACDATAVITLPSGATYTVTLP